jgi:GNAT superfamily N-acetyltransferase
MAFGSTLAREESFPESVWRERAAGGASGTDRVTFIAEREGEWLGLASGIATDPGSPSALGPFLVGMFVDPAARRHGLGAVLVEAVVEWAGSRGAARLYLWVTSTNDPAIALYSKCGFRRTGDTQPLAHSPSVTELQMVRELR